MVEKHDLIHELPEYRQQIHDLKVGNKHFARLFDDYHDLDREVRRIEEGVEAAGDVYLENQKKRRLKLKDDLFAMLHHEGEK